MAAPVRAGLEVGGVSILGSILPGLIAWAIAIAIL